MEYNWEDLAREGLGEPTKDGKGFKGGIWIIKAFSSPVTRQDYTRGEFHAHPDGVLQKYANASMSEYVHDVRKPQAKSRSLKMYPINSWANPAGLCAGTTFNG